MDLRKNVLVVLADDYMAIGGLRIPATRYIEFLEEKYELNIVLMGYHVHRYHDIQLYKSKVLSKINENTHAIIVFSGINQAYTTIRLLNDIIPLKCKKIFYLADSPFLFMKSHLELCKDDVKSVLDRLLYYAKATKYYFKEKDVLKKYDEIMYVSPVDAEFVRKTYKQINANISIIAHASDLHNKINFATGVDVNSFRIGFLTAISEHSYTESIKPLIFDIMPRVIRKYPNTRLLIVGKGSSEKRVTEIKMCNYVEHKDFVENLDDFYDNVDIVIAPIRKRNGILNKVLEAWGYGKCTVGYKYNFEAFTEAQEGIHYVCGKDSKEIADKILDILSGNINIEEISRASYMLIKEEYNWENQKQKFMDIVG